MEIKQLTKTQFVEMANEAGKETYQTTYENDAWYEQVTVGEVTYRNKLLSLKKTSSELLVKKAFESTPAYEPIRLRNQGNVVALVFNTKSTVFYHVLPGTKSEMARAKRLVIFFAKSLLPKNQELQEVPSEITAA